MLKPELISHNPPIKKHKKMQINPPGGAASLQVTDRVPTTVNLIKSKCHVVERLNRSLMRETLMKLPAAVPQKGDTCSRT